MPSFFSKRKRPVHGDVPSELKGQASGQRRIVVWAKRLIGLALLAYVLGTAEWEQVWVHITKPNGYGMVLLFLAPVLLIGTSAAKWWLLLRVKGVHLSFWMAFQLYSVQWVCCRRWGSRLPCFFGWYF